MIPKLYLVKVKNTKTKETRVRNVKLQRDAYMKMLQELNKEKNGFQLIEIVELD
jgi:hypothetical protein